MKIDILAVLFIDELVPYISGHIDHAARVMQVITWNKSFRGVPNGDGSKDNLDGEDYETHATILDKLLAWEKKLYEEVKVNQKLPFHIYISLESQHL